MNASVIELAGVDFIRQGCEILSGIDWRIEAGRHWALMGANGSGKTTLLKIITGYEWPTSGQVRVLGQKFGQTNIPELRKHIGWVSASVEQKLPGYDKAIDVVASGIEASLGLYRDFAPAEYQQAMEVLMSLNGAAIAGRQFETLSQGEQQKVLIARALINRPQVLILDEPCAGLDPAARQRFLNDISRLSRQSQCPTIILVTHHIEEIGDWIGNVLLLKEGRISAGGRVDDVLTSENLSQAFNFLCQVKHSSGGWHLIVEKS